MAAENEEECYEVLLDEIYWSFDDRKYETVEEFYDALEKYHHDIEEPMAEEILGTLGFRKVKIIFDYTVVVDGKWADVRKEVNLESQYKEFNELEILYELTAVPLTFISKPTDWYPVFPP